MVVFFVVVLIALYFNYLMYSNAITSLWDFVFRIGLLFLFVPYIAAMLSFEFFYSRMTKKPPDLRRFGARILFDLIIVLSFLGFLLIADYIISPFLGDWNAALVGTVVWTIAFFVILTKFRYFITKFTEGKW